MANPVVHFEVVGTDVPTLVRFYGEVFGWQMREEMDSYWMANPGEREGIGGGIGRASEGSRGHATFYIRVADPDTTLERINGLGGTTVTETTEVPDGPTIAHFADPEGNVVGLIKGGD